MHVSALVPGESPHPPHQHIDEEILIVLSGSPEIAEINPSSGLTQWTHLNSGDSVFYPSGFTHTIRNSGPFTANYLMMRWSGCGRGPLEKQQSNRHIDRASASGVFDDVNFGSIQRRYAFATRWLLRLEHHITALKPGSGYPEHKDRHDVAILLVDGVINVGKIHLKPFSFLHIPAGRPHGMHNPGPMEARYLVFEFHGKKTAVLLLRVLSKGRNGFRRIIRLLRQMAKKLFRG
jgi:mannose-6-phosphate isomerase-like protein (cupin superfamily)